MYVGLAFKPLDTATFIQLHAEALRSFRGMPAECVYDQTKLAVLSEQYRELTLNPRFHEFATTAGFRIRPKEHTSEPQQLMSTSNAASCLTKQKPQTTTSSYFHTINHQS